MSSKFAPSPAEVALVNQIFAQADTQKLGVVTGDAAVKIFSGSNLPGTVLAEVWNLSDDENKGVLTRKDVAVALRLLGHAQRGERVTEALIHKPGNVPVIDGLNAPVARQVTGVPTPRSPPPAASGLPPLTPQDKAKFMKLFLGCGPTNGLLPGDKAFEVLVKSKLPVDKLSQIWNLADTKSRGALDATDFTVAMYLIQAAMSNQIPIIPTSLPPYILDQAKQTSGLGGVTSHATGDSGQFSPTHATGFPRSVSAIQPQYTGSMQPIQPQSTGTTRTAPSLPPRAPFATASASTFPLVAQTTGQQLQWDVTSQEKASSDKFFEGLDTLRKGYVEGDVVVPFLRQSKLADEVLARIWDLADLNNDGKLTKDGFAVAMHLIQAKLQGKEIPATLPASLIPPSMRSTTTSNIISPPQTQQHVSESIQDLLWDDTPPSSAVATQPPAIPSFPTGQSLIPQRTGGAAGTFSPHHTAGASIHTQPTASVFGRALDTQDPFGGSFGSIAPPPAHRDLLGDDDEAPAAAATASPPLQDKSAEIGNAQNQLSSTTRAVETAKREREDLEKALAEQASTLSQLQTQLSSAKASYETETRLLTTLRERHSTQSADITKLRSELITQESSLSAVRLEKSEVEQSVLRDKEEVRELQRKMVEVGKEVEVLKTETERVRKEGKQQKGLVAIARKQLSTREAEKSRIKEELHDAEKELADANMEKDEVDEQLAKLDEEERAEEAKKALNVGDSLSFAAAHPLPASPDPQALSPNMTGTSSITSPTKSNNPFERLAFSSSPPPSGAQSPVPAPSAFLPFSGSAMLPTPSNGAAPEAATGSVKNDPFGFDAAFGAAPEPHVQATEMPEPEETKVGSNSQEIEASPFGEVEEKPVAVHGQGLGGDLFSPTSDMFVTPPGSATLQEAILAPTSTTPAASSPVEASIPGHFSEEYPKMDQAKGKEIAAQEGQKDDETDLNAQLKELDVEESDSDTSDDDDDDDEPLSGVKAKLQHNEQDTPSAFDDSFGLGADKKDEASPFDNFETPKVPNGFPPVPTVATAPSLFPSVPAQTSVTPTSHFPTTSISTSASTSTPATEAGVSDFDEALGKLGGSSSEFSQVSQFTFDSAFDDDFDFAAAKAATADTNGNGSESQVNGGATPSASTITTRPVDGGFDAVFLGGSGPSAFTPTPASSAFPPAPVAVAAPPQQPESRSFSFDDAFSTSAAPPAQAPSAFVPPQTGSTPTPSVGISFDDAFGGDSGALSLDNSFTSATSNGTNPSSVLYQPPAGPPPGQQQKSGTSFPTNATSPPSSPAMAATLNSNQSARSVSPTPTGSGRTVSPPPRRMSPRPVPRPNTGGGEKEKEKTKHSKLSIRFPFGRKKAKHDETKEHPMPSHLSQSHLAEEPGANATPAADDDIEAVKTLCSMGFSRTQAVTALEASDYDVQKALNSLLGTR